MNYPVGFFSLTYTFARRAAQLNKCSLAEALLRYTHLYMAFGLGRSFNPSAREWQGFLAGLDDAEDPAVWMHATCHRLTKRAPARVPEPAFGCFAYDLWDGGRVRLHFFNPDSGKSPLRAEAAVERRAELTQLIAYIRNTVPEARTIVGGSWLYNIEAYRRLFPPEFLASARPEEPPEVQFMALWGQFLNHRREIKEETARRFLAAVEQADTLDELLHAFPYPVLRLECPVEVFYQAYADPQ